MATMQVELPQTLDELNALYAKLKAGLPPQPIPRTNAEFEAQEERHYTAALEVLDDELLLGYCLLGGERMVHLREQVEHQLDVLCEQYAHVFQDKAMQSSADVRRGNLEADEALLRILLLMMTAIPWTKMRLALNELPQPDDTLRERLSLVLCAVVNCVSPTGCRKLMRQLGLLERNTTLQYLTSREVCRMLVGVLRFELASKLQTYGELAKAAAAPAQGEQQQAPAKFRTDDVHVAQWYLEMLRRVTNLTPMPA